MNKSNKKIYFVGTPSQVKGIDEFNSLAKLISEADFFWFCFKLPEGLQSVYPNINFIAGLSDQQLRDKIENEMDVFVCCSHFEGFSVPIAEAMLLKKPVIAYKLEELVDIYGDHITFMSSDLEEAAKIILSVLKAKSSSLDESREMILSRYSPKSVSDKLINILFR